MKIVILTLLTCLAVGTGCATTDYVYIYDKEVKTSRVQFNSYDTTEQDMNRVVAELSRIRGVVTVDESFDEPKGHFSGHGRVVVTVDEREELAVRNFMNSCGYKKYYP